MPKATLMGCGFYGKVHLQNLESAGIDVIGIHDRFPFSQLEASFPKFKLDADKYKGLFIPNPEDFWALVAKEKPSVHIITNTTSHGRLVQRALDLTDAVISEKPTAFNFEETQALARRLETDSSKFFATSYVLRSSLAVREVLSTLRENGEKVVSVDTQYYKDRTKDLRPTAGEVRDEATHPLDMILYVLARNNQEVRSLSDIIFNKCITEHKPFANPEAQGNLYDSMVAENGAEVVEKEYGTRQQFLNLDSGIEFEGNFGSVNTTFFSSFAITDRPQNRQMTFVTDKGNSYIVKFDIDGGDWLNGTKYDGSKKLLEQVKGFYQGVESRTQPVELSSIREALFIEGLKDRILRGA